MEVTACISTVFVLPFLGIPGFLDTVLPAAVLPAPALGLVSCTRFMISLPCHLGSMVVFYGFVSHRSLPACTISFSDACLPPAVPAVLGGGLEVVRFYHFHFCHVSASDFWILRFLPFL